MRDMPKVRGYASRSIDGGAPSRFRTRIRDRREPPATLVQNVSLAIIVLYALTPFAMLAWGMILRAFK